MIEASSMLGVLGDLDRKVRQEVLNGKSALHIAIEVDDKLYESCIKELTEIINHLAGNNGRQKLLNLVRYWLIPNEIAMPRYAIKILWFRTAFDNYNGQFYVRDFHRRLGVGDVYLNGDFELTDALNAFRSSSPFPFCGLPEFREYVWFHGHPVAGQTSDLQEVVNCAIRSDEDNRFNPHNPGYAQYEFARSMLKRHEDEWHRGDDFRRVLTEFCNPEFSIENAERWVRRILQNFPPRDFGKCDFYLRWHSGDNHGDGIVGWDRFKFADGNDLLVQCTGMQETRTTIPQCGRLAQPVGLRDGQVSGGWRRPNGVAVEFTYDEIDVNNLCEGIWFRHKTKNDTWWERASALRNRNNIELKSAKNIPANKRQVLIVRRVESADRPAIDLPDGVRVESECNVRIKLGLNGGDCGYGQYNFTLLELTRSREERTIEAYGFTARVNSGGMQIEADDSLDGVADFEDSLIVSVSQSLHCDGSSLEADNFEWQINGRIVEGKEECTIPQDVPLGQKIRVVCKVGLKQATCQLVVFPEEVVSAVRGAGGVPAGWRIEEEESAGSDYITNAIDGYEVVRVINPQNAIVGVFRSLRGPIWWLESAAGYDEKTRCCQSREFGRDGVGNWSLAFPRSCEQQIKGVLTFDGRTIGSAVEEFSDYLRVRLSALTAEEGVISLEDLSSSHELKVGDTVVAKWSSVPSKLTFVNTEHGLAIYVPETYDHPTIGVAFFADNIGKEDFVASNLREFSVNEINNSRLVSVEEWKNEIVERHRSSEIFLGLRLDTGARSALFARDFLDPDKFRLMKVSDGDTPLTQDSLVFKFLSFCVNEIALDGSHPYRVSRVLQMLIPRTQDVQNVEPVDVATEALPETLPIQYRTIVNRRIANEYAQYDQDTEVTHEKVVKLDSDFELVLRLGINPIVESGLFNDYCRCLSGCTNGGVADFIRADSSRLAIPILVQFLLERRYPSHYWYNNLQTDIGLPAVNGLGVYGNVNGARRRLSSVGPIPYAFQGRYGVRLTFDGVDVDVRDGHGDCMLLEDGTQWERCLVRAFDDTLVNVLPTDAEPELQCGHDDEAIRRVTNGSIDLAESNRGGLLSSWSIRLIQECVSFVHENNDQYTGYSSGLKCVILSGLFLALRAYIATRGGNPAGSGQFQYDYDSLVAEIYSTDEKQSAYGKTFTYSMCFMLTMLHYLNFTNNAQ